jgi:hypothetical protein
MSILKVASIHFEETGTKKIDYNNDILSISVGETVLSGNVRANGNGSIKIPVGTTGERPTGEAGMFRYNTTTGKFEGHNASGWGAVVSSANTSNAGIVKLATAGEWRTGTDTSSALAVSETWSSAAEVTITDAATITVDGATFINAVITLEGNRTLGTWSNAKVGQSGYIRVVQDATGSRTLAYHGDYEFAFGSTPTLSTAANAEDLLFYQVIASGRVFISFVGSIS